MIASAYTHTLSPALLTGFIGEIQAVTISVGSLSRCSTTQAGVVPIVSFVIFLSWVKFLVIFILQYIVSNLLFAVK